MLAQVKSDPIDARQQAFLHIEKNAKRVKKILDEKVLRWDKIEKISGELVTQSQRLKTAFPKESQEGSNAKEAVWDKPEKFNSLLDEMVNGFVQLYQASQQENQTLGSAGLEKAQDTCRSCHRRYRAW